MPNELDQYLDSLGLEDQDRTQLASILGKAGDRATAPLLMRGDYTKKTQELARERERISNETMVLNNQLSKALTDLEAGRTTAAQYEARLARIQEEYGIDQSDVLKPPTRQQEPPKPQVDPQLLQRLEQAERNYGVSPEISAILMDIRSDYEDTFGSVKGFSASELLKFSRENKLPLRSDPINGGRGAYEEFYKVRAKRQEKLVADITAKATADAEAKVQQRIDQLAVGNTTGERNPNTWAQNGSHVLSKNFQQNQNTRIEERAKENGRSNEGPPSQSRTAAQAELEGGGSAFAKAFINRRAKGIGFGEQEKVA